MLETLKELLLAKQNKETCEHSIEDYDLILEENARLKERNRRLNNLLDSALDELISNRERIEALLKQLKDKNGGQ